MSVTGQELEQRVAHLEQQVERLQKVLLAVVAQQLDGGTASDIELGRTANSLRPAMPVMTTKQHVVLQMLTRGASNDEIAKRMGVTINTAKVHVRSVARKLGERKRAAIGVRASEWLSGLEPEEYARLSGGLPMNWDAEYQHPDPHASLYRADHGA